MAATYDRALKRVNAVSEAVLAELVERDVQQLTEHALDGGVTAYLERPVHRSRPNERFLQSTIRSVAGSNRREQEAQLWEAHRSHSRLMQQAGQPTPERVAIAEGPWQSTGSRNGRDWEGRCRSPDNATETSSDGEGAAAGLQPAAAREGMNQGAGMGEEEMLTMLSRRRVKGRGAVGPRVDEPGPYLPAPQAASSHGLHDPGREPSPAAARRAAGPEAPEWLRARAAVADDAAIQHSIEVVQEARKRKKGKKRDRDKEASSGKQKRKKRRKQAGDAV